MRLCSILVRVAEKHRECELRFRAGVSCQCRFLCYVSRARVADQGGLDRAGDLTKVVTAKTLSWKKAPVDQTWPSTRALVPEIVQSILDLGTWSFWQEVQNLQKVRLLIG